MPSCAWLIFAAIAFGTVTVKIETVVSQANAMFCGNFTLTRFDGIITKFDNLAAVEANQVIVVMLLMSVQIRIYRLQNCGGDDTSVVKLVQYAIYRSQTNFFTHIDQTFV